MTDKRGSTARGQLPSAGRAVFIALGRVRHGQLEIAVPGGQRFSFLGTLPGPCAWLELRDWEVCTDVLRSGSLGFAEAYIAGRCVTPDLTALLTLAALNRFDLEGAPCAPTF